MNKHAYILIVDDQVANTMLLENILEDFGYENFASINDPTEVMLSINVRKPDLILLDLRMPKLSGFEVIKQVQQRFPQNTPLIMVLTAQTDSKSRESCIDMGVSDFLTKPFDHIEVIQRIENLLSLHHYHPQSITNVAHKYSDLDQRSESELKRITLQDPVTQLPNRRAVVMRLVSNRLLKDKFAVACIDVSGFESSHYLQGYIVIDYLMQYLAHEMTALIKKEDVFLAHWSESTFILILEDSAEKRIEPLLAKIIKLISSTHIVNQQRFDLLAKAGYLLTHQAELSPENILRKASIAVPTIDSELTIQAYNNDLEEKYKYFHDINNLISVALEENQFSLVFQAKYCLHSDKIKGCETLLRWQNDRLGFISPGTFIPIAESSGKIIDIGDWVLAQSFSQLFQWQSFGVLDDDFLMAINISPRQLQSVGFSQRLSKLLTQWKIKPQHIELEITEYSMINNNQQTIRVLDDLRKLGFRIALDDFGTGYSNLSYMKNVPLDTLKIDRSFVTNIDSQLESRKLVDIILAMANAFNLSVVAEGIETEAEAAYLKQQHVEFAQGYYFATPLNANDFITHYQQAS